MGSWLDPLASVANNLINKASDTVGWVANHSTPDRQALDTYIKDIQERDISPLVKAALISDAKRTIKEYKNQQDILQLAQFHLLPTANPNGVSDDWIAQLFDKARLVSDAQFQVIWGKILAEECNTPGSIPKALLHILGQMDKQHAEDFAKVSSFSVCYQTKTGVHYTPIIPYYSYQSYFVSKGLSYDALVDLKAIGLIEVEFQLMGSSAFVQAELVNPTVWYFDDTYTLSMNKDILPVGGVIFTRVGEALCKAVGQQKVDDFFDECCLPFWTSHEKLVKE